MARMKNPTAAAAKLNASEAVVKAMTEAETKGWPKVADRALSFELALANLGFHVTKKPVRRGTRQHWTAAYPDVLAKLAKEGR